MLILMSTAFLEGSIQILVKSEKMTGVGVRNDAAGRRLCASVKKHNHERSKSGTSAANPGVHRF